MKIETRALSFSYGKFPILKDMYFSADSGEMIALLGPNGAGKTTFFRCLLGFLKPENGDVFVNDKSICSYSKKELSKEIAYIPQTYNPVFNHTVEDSVMMGFANSLDLFSSPDENHRQKAFSVMSELGIGDLAKRGCTKISGGERQLMLIARALVQDARILIMDEPTANLDFGNSFRVMQKISELCKKGYTIIMSTHDPILASRFATRVVAIKGGNKVADGNVGIINSGLIEMLYGVKVEVCSSCNGVVLK